MTRSHVPHQLQASGASGTGDRSTPTRTGLKCLIRIGRASLGRAGLGRGVIVLYPSTTAIVTEHGGVWIDLL